jgi:hypothetical protein
LAYGVESPSATTAAKTGRPEKTDGISYGTRNNAGLLHDSDRTLVF